ncbi:anti-sigma factor antagonist [Streptomyces albofaciens JCM 4342]|uniref:STAS domain-containing protein n=1 Tax=Streptomyces albofaciens TaxID=66866 RepID=UPI001238A070|nr:STAS domain-containing protein [Streptomyces albofaciens]KAA6223805.1 anti-sigma factor antagonist [Streptomyces albofaciens JCM 4342]
MSHPSEDLAPCRAVHTYRLGRAIVVELRGEIDMWTAPTVRSHLRYLTQPRGAVLVVDLRPVTFFDCSGLEALLDAHHWTVLGRGRLKVVCDDTRILHLLNTTRTHALFHPTATLAEALPG